MRSANPSSHAGQSAPARMLRALVAVVLASASLLVQGSAPTVTHAAIRTVPIGGSLQTAVNNSQPGDVIRLAGNIQANEQVNLALMGSAVGSGPGNLTIVGINGASATLMGGNGTRISYNSATPFPGTLVFDSVTIATSASTTGPGMSLVNMGNVIFFNTLFDGIGAEGCSTAPSGCTGLRIEVSSGSPTIAIYSSTFRNIASNAVAVIASGTADLTLLTHTSLFTDNGVYATVPNTGIYLSASGNATVNQSVAQSSFSNLSQAAVHTISGGAAIVNTSVVSNVISNMTGASPGVIALETASGAGSAPTLSAQIADNQLSSVAGDGISVNYQSPGGALSLNSRDNIINNVDPAQPKHGISIRSAPGAQGDMTVTAIGNQISSTGGSGIRADVADLGAQVNLRANNLSDNNQANGNDAAIFLRGGSGSTGGAAFNVRGAIIGNTIPAAGVRLGEYATASLQLEATGPSAEDYIAANNTFSGGGTVALLPVSNPIGTLALGSVPTLIENLHPAAYADGSLTPITVPNSIASTINVLGNDAAGDPGDSVHLWTFSGVSARGGVISRNDNGTPGNLTDDRLTYTPLPTETGLDRFYYVVRDNGGRSAIAQVVLNLVADSTPPDTTITTPPGNPSNDTTPTFQFTGTDNVTPPGSLAFQCRLYLTSATPPAFASCTSPSTSAALPDGSYTFQVRAVDQAGNIDPTPASYTWQIDSTGPTTTINTTPANPTNSASANFTFSASDGTGSGVAGFSCSLDGAAFTACTSPQSYAGLADGSHTFRVRATDNAGNTGAIASYTWTVDTAPPDTTITANPTALSNSSTATFQFTGNALGGAAIAGFECSLDGGAFIACASPRVYTGLADGSHTFAVRAIDAAGNVDATPATFTWTVDTTPPPAPVTNTPANGSVTNNPLPPVTGSAEPSATVNIFIDGSVVGNTTADASGSWSYAPTIPLGNGPHTTRARAADAAGNVSVDSNTNTFTVDTVEPDTTFTVTPPAATNSTSANFSFIGAGTGSVVARFECSLDGVAYATCASPQNLSGLAEGAHTFRVRAVDAAGNTDTSPASYAWTVDLTAADTTITGNPPALSASANATFSFTGNDPTSGGVASGVAGFECSLDGGAFTTCASGLTLTGLSDGAHTFAVRAIDAAGNVDASPASYAWTIDTTPPPAPVTNTPANSSVTNNPLPPITGSAEPGATLTVFIDGSAAGTATADGSGNWSFTPSVPLGNGAHTARARASDPAGNTSVDSNTNTFTVDTVEPDTTLTATPPSPTSSTSANFSFTGAGTGSAVARFECSLDGAAFATCASPQNLSGLAEGSRTFRVRAVDAAGNTDTTPASFTWLIDLTAPDTTITANPPVLSNSANATFAFTGNDGAGSGVASFECSLDGGAFTACASGLTLTGLSDGAHTFAVRAIDNAGNVDGSPASYAWTVDTTPPPAPLTNTPANGSVTNNPLPPVTGSAESGAVVTVFIDGSSIGTVTADASGNWSLTPPAPLTDGTHTTRARASDPAGNTSVDSNTNTFTVDTAEPDTTLTATPPAISNSASASFAFTGAGTGSAVARFECSLDGAPFATCASPQNLSGLAEGSRTFRVRAVDIAGNTESTPASFTWRIDLTAPDTTITANPTNPSASANASFSFSGNDGAGSGVASLECSLDGATFAACASPQSYAGLADGSHTFAVRAIDAAGNVDASPASFTWLIDTTPAQVTINQASGQADPAATAPISFTVVFSEPVSGFGSAPGDIDLSASTAPGTLAATVTGSGTTYAVVVSGMRGPGLVIASVPAGAASDPAGNASAASTSSDNRVTFNPSIPAVAAIVRAGASPTRAATVDFTVTFSEPVLNVDTADFALALSGVTGASITGVTGSGATWTVTAATGAGNGALGLNLIDNDSILSSRAAIPLGGDGAGNGNATGESYVINRNYYVYLPQVQRPSFANLTASVRISPQRSMFAAGEPVVVTVTITNTGNAPAAPFWVDLYLNPRQAPAANQPWNTLCGQTPCFGLAWAVSSPLAPGQSVTLASTPGSYAAGQSVWPGWLPSGTTEIVALVDSFGPSEAGAVAESNEADNRATLRGLTVTGQNPPARPSQPALAPRGDPASAE